MLLPACVVSPGESKAYPVFAPVLAAKPIRVGIIEDQLEVRRALSQLVGSSDDFKLTGAYDSVEGAVANLKAAMPDVLLVDLGLPGMSGMEGIRSFRTQWPKLILLVLTIHEESRYIFEALCAGADGYLLKGIEAPQLLASIGEAAAGGAPISPSIAGRVIRLFREHRPSPAEDIGLTPHEFRILKMLAAGENYKSTARLLNVSVNTISFHVRSIYSKLHVHSRSAAVAKALRTGLIF